VLPKVARICCEFFSPGMDTEIWFLPWLATVAPLVPAFTRLLMMVTMVSSWAELTGVCVW
jgi:beta-lactamase regulating signal transducer with metallopeptidase domain